MILYQITVVHRSHAARPPKVFYRTSRRDAIREAVHELGTETEKYFTPARVIIRKLVFKDIPPKKLALAILNANVMPRLWDRVVESEELVWDQEGKV